ncbi:hypothetical protein AVEN_159267-1 [Araneus ventricosus]|uniref:Uncharacterized protein n=1 Tax=Araneus ventricosus TaxID=182803 RepID=A0A4Y2A0C6_ARAVE|nr:hypothetical protein AVEN_159267-1 [Araneus ventricosus]
MVDVQKKTRYGKFLLSLKLCSNCLSFLEFRPRFALFLAVGTERIDMARGLVSAPGVSSVVAVNSSHIKEARRRHCIRPFDRCRDICKATRHTNGMSVRIPPTTAHKCEPRATRSLDKPYAVGTRLKTILKILKNPDIYI